MEHLNKKEVCARYKFTAMSLHRLRASSDTFPLPLCPGGRRLLWLEHELDARDLEQCPRASVTPAELEVA